MVALHFRRLLAIRDFEAALGRRVASDKRRQRMEAPDTDERPFL